MERDLLINSPPLVGETFAENIGCLSWLVERQLFLKAMALTA